MNIYIPERPRLSPQTTVAVGITIAVTDIIIMVLGIKAMRVPNDQFKSHTEKRLQVLFFSIGLQIVALVTYVVVICLLMRRKIAFNEEKQALLEKASVLVDRASENYDQWKTQNREDIHLLSSLIDIAPHNKDPEALDDAQTAWQDRYALYQAERAQLNRYCNEKGADVFFSPEPCVTEADTENLAWLQQISGYIEEITVSQDQ